MSNPFRAVQAPPLPNIVCVGMVESIGSTEPTKSEKYNKTPIKLVPNGGGFPIQFQLLTRPDWLVAGFDPDKELADNNSAQFVYERNIAGTRGVSLLLGLAGTEEAANNMGLEIQAAAVEEKDPETNSTYLAVPNEALDRILQKYVTRPIGYILKQKTEKIDGSDDRVRLRSYEIDQLFFPDEDALKRYRALASKKPDTWRVAFDEAF